MTIVSFGRCGRVLLCTLATCLIILFFQMPAYSMTVDSPLWPTLGGNMQRSGLSPNVGPTIGCVKWTFDTAAPPTNKQIDPIYPPAGLNSSVALGSDGTIYFTSENGTLYALNPAGEQLWKYAFQPPVKQAWAWPLNDGSGATPDATYGPFDGEMVNFADPNCWVLDEKFGFALQFDGIDDYIRIPGLTGVGSSLPRRISAWVKTTTSGPIVHWGNAESDEGVWRLELTADGKPAVIAQGSAVADLAIDDGQWHQVEAILPPGGFQAADIILKIDGQQVAMTVTPGANNWIDTDDLCDVYIGHDPVAGKYFEGLLADIQIQEHQPNSNTVSGPTIGPDGTIFAAYGQTLYAVNPDGLLIWSYNTGGFINGSPVVNDTGTVIFGSADGKIYGINRVEGYEWILDGLYDARRPVITAPTLAIDGSVLIGSVYDATLYCLDPTDGHIRWTCNLDSGDDHTAKSFVASPVVAPDGTIYAVLAGDTNLYAIDPTDGSILRTTNLNFTPDLYAYWPVDLPGFDPLTGCYAYNVTGNMPLYDISSSHQTMLLTSFFFRFAKGVHSSALAGRSMYSTNFKWPAGMRARTIMAWLWISPYADEYPFFKWPDSETTDTNMEVFRAMVLDNDHLRIKINNGYMDGIHSITPQWYHVAIVIRDNGPDTNIDAVSVYLNGELDADSTTNSGFKTCSYPIGIRPQYTTYSIRLGRYDNAYAIDDVRIYSVALSQTQIREVMEAETGPVWRDPQPPETTSLTDLACWTGPVVAPDGTIYLVMNDGYLRGIRSDGSVKWVKHLTGQGDYSLSVDPRGLLYVAAPGGMLFVIDSDGHTISSMNVAPLTIRCTSYYLPDCAGKSDLIGPAIAPDGTLYLGDAYNRLWAVGRQGCEGKRILFSNDAFDRANLSPDLRIDLLDIAAFAQQWLQCSDRSWPCTDYRPPKTWKYIEIQKVGNCDIYQLFPAFLAADANQDGYVDLHDLVLVMDLWLAQE